MTELQRFLLLKIAEECSELAKECSNLIQLGADRSYEGQTFLQRFINEKHDVIASLKMFEETGVKIPDTTEEQVDAKRKRMADFIGTCVQEENTVYTEEILNFLLYKPSKGFKVTLNSLPNMELIRLPSVNEVYIENGAKILGTFHKMLVGASTAEHALNNGIPYNGTRFTIDRNSEGHWFMRYVPLPEDLDPFTDLENMFVSHLFSADQRCLMTVGCIQDLQVKIQKQEPIDFSPLGFTITFGE